MATDHWFDISAARRDLGYAPNISMATGTAELIEHLKSSGLDYRLLFFGGASTTLNQRLLVVKMTFFFPIQASLNVAMT